jgi:hypothetical protein
MSVGAYQIRRWYTLVEETLRGESGGSDAGGPLWRVVVAAAIKNPYAGRYSEDLSAIVADSPLLGAEFGARLVAALGGRPVESYGKSALVGTAGELEHGNAFLTTAFANPVRAAVGGGKAWITSTGKRGALGAPIDVPLAHKDALYVRSHYDTISVSFPDAPAPDEVVVIFAAASRGRINARLGGLRREDVKGQDGLT